MAKWVRRYEAEGPDRAGGPAPRLLTGSLTGRRRAWPGGLPAIGARVCVPGRSPSVCGWPCPRSPRSCAGWAWAVAGIAAERLVVRYEWQRPGDLIHIDVKKLGRFREAGHRVGQRHYRNSGIGWEFVYVCVDDATRLAYVEVLADERKETAVGFLQRAWRWLRRRRIRVCRVMTDNGSPFVSNLFARCCDELGIRHLRTRPYRPRTNGKAERFIQTLQREWAYGKPYRSSAGPPPRTPGLAALLQSPAAPSCARRLPPIARLRAT